MKTANFLTKIKYKLSKRKVQTRSFNQTYKVSDKVKKNKASKLPKIQLPSFSKVVAIICIVTIVIGLLGKFVYPNVKAYTNLSFNSIDESSRTIWNKDSNLNVAFMVIDSEDDYQFIKSFYLLSFSKTTSNIKVLNVNTNIAFDDKTFGDNVNIKQIYQLSKIKKQSYNDLVNSLEQLFGLRIDRFLLTDTDSLRSLVADMSPLNVKNDFDGNGFKKGSVSLTNLNYYQFLYGQWPTTKAQLSIQNQFLVSLLKRFDSPQVFFNLADAQDYFFKTTDSNLNKDEMWELFNIVKSYKNISLNYTSTNVIDKGNEDDFDVFNIGKFDSQIQTVFGDPSLNREQARVEVLNASTTNALASRVARFLRNSGLKISRAGNFGVQTNKNIIYVSDKIKYANSAEFLKKFFPTAEFRYESPEKYSTADILIIVSDFQL